MCPYSNISRHPGLGLERAEVITALSNMVYGVLHKTNPWAYSKTQMYHVSHAEIRPGQAAKIATWTRWGNVSCVVPMHQPHGRSTASFRGGNSGGGRMVHASRCLPALCFAAVFEGDKVNCVALAKVNQQASDAFSATTQGESNIPTRLLFAVGPTVHKRGQ